MYTQQHTNPHMCVSIVPCRSVMTDASKYFITIEPGVDAAFVVALAILCDEVFHDERR